MQNLEQIRASQALRFWNPPNGQRPDAGGVNKGDVINGLPALIINNGLLATLAFAKAKGGGHSTLMLEVCRFLCDSARKALPPAPPRQANEADLDPYIRLLTEGKDATSVRLQIATTEALAYLSYLKRFAP
jgi:CRISPR/Cas system CMR-associated protein Cmr5 small subunit